MKNQTNAKKKVHLKNNWLRGKMERTELKEGFCDGLFFSQLSAQHGYTKQCNVTKPQLTVAREGCK